MQQSEVARRAGVAVATVSRLLSGDRQPSFDMMVRIEEAIGWPVEQQANARKFGNYGNKLDEAIRRAADDQEEPEYG